MSRVREYILGAIEEKAPLKGNDDIDALDFVSGGYIDSLGLIRFVVGMEDEFGIEFSDDELAMPSFTVVGELVKIVEEKIQAGERRSA